MRNYLIVLYFLLAGVVIISSPTMSLSGKAINASLLDSAKSLFYESLEDYDEDSTLFFEKINRSVSLLKQHLEKNPQDPEAFYFYGYALVKKRFGISSGEVIPAIKLSDITEISDAFEKCIAITPHYNGEEYLLSPYSKITSLWGSLAMAYNEQGKHDSAEFAFKEGKRRGGFPDFLLEFCRNTMNSCDSGSVLFVNGDNDTFPMYYLMAIDNFRTDLRVINISLTNAQWYLLSLKKRTIYGNPAIPLSFSDEMINAPQSSPKRLKYEYDKEKSVTVNLPASYVKNFPALNETKAKKNTVITFTGLDNENDDKKKYLYRIQDLVIIDIVKQLAFTKKIYFAKTIHPEAFAGLSPYLSNEFLTLLVNPFFPKKDFNEKIWNLASDSYLDAKENIKGRFTFNSIDFDKILNDHDQQRLLSTYWDYTVEYAKYLADDKEDYAGAIDILVALEKIIPFAKYLPFYNNIYDAMSVLIDAEADQQRINYFARSCTKAAERQLVSNPSPDPDDYSDFLEKVYYPLSRISECSFIVGNYERQREALKELLTKNAEYSKNPIAIKEFDGNFMETYQSVRFSAKAEYDISLIHETRLVQSDDIAIQKALLLIKEYKSGNDSQKNELIENIREYIEQIESGE